MKTPILKQQQCSNPSCLHKWWPRSENGAKRCPRCQKSLKTIKLSDYGVKSDKLYRDTATAGIIDRPPQLKYAVEKAMAAVDDAWKRKPVKKQ